MKNKFSSFVKIKNANISYSLAIAAALTPSAYADSPATNAPINAAAATPSTTASAPALSPAWQKPAWLTDLSAGVKQSYDDNVLLVSGLGLPKENSWISSASAKVGFDFVPLLSDQNLFKSLTFVYSPDVNIYYDAPQENSVDGGTHQHHLVAARRAGGEQDMTTQRVRRFERFESHGRFAGQ